MRTLLRFLFSAVGLLTASYLVPGIGHGAFLNLLVVAVLLAALNATLGSLLKTLAFLPVACSFGCLSLFINGLVFWLVGALASRLDLGFSVRGFWAGFFGALVSSVVAAALEWILLGRRHQAPPRRDEPRPVKIIN